MLRASAVCFFSTASVARAKSASSLVATPAGELGSASRKAWSAVSELLPGVRWLR